MSTTASEWPTLVMECRTMLISSIIAYAFSDLRKLDRLKKLSDDHSKLLALPCDLKDIMELSIANEKVLADNISNGALAVYNDALKCAYDLVVAEEAEALEKDGKKDEDEVMAIVAWGDEDSEEGLVYGITVNSIEKRVIVCFRGSVTNKDFLTDANCVIADYHFPPGAEGPKSLIGIHKGFHDYLFKAGKDGKESKSKQILAELATLFVKYPDYKLYVSGHSLGAALASLFTMAAAISEDVPKPVTCINVASPKCGNAAFQKAFHKLEKDGNVRSFRMRNDQDMIPKLPERSSISVHRYLIGRGVVYHHVGTEIVLYEDGKHEIAYPNTDGNYFRELTTEPAHKVGIWGTLTFALAQKKHYSHIHSCNEYFKRFNSFAKGKDERELYLDQLSMA